MKLTRFLAPLAVAAMLALAGCGATDAVYQNVKSAVAYTVDHTVLSSAELNRQDVLKAEKDFRDLDNSLVSMARAGIVIGQNATDAKNLLQSASTALSAWNRNPDDATARSLAEAAIAKLRIFHDSIPIPASPPAVQAPTAS